MTFASARPALAALLLQFLALFAPYAAGAASLAVPCVSANATFGAAELVCAIPQQPHLHRLRFKLPFAGVHDDSSAGMAATLDGAPVACTVDSRPQIRGEAEGDTLSCDMAIESATAPRELRLQLVWFHAEPGDYSLRAD